METIGNLWWFMNCDVHSPCVLYILARVVRLSISHFEMIRWSAVSRQPFWKICDHCNWKIIWNHVNLTNHWKTICNFVINSVSADGLLITFICYSNATVLNPHTPPPPPHPPTSPIWGLIYRRNFSEVRARVNNYIHRFLWDVLTHPYPFCMLTSSNGNIFRITGPLCGEFTGHRWIPRTKASHAELWWCFLWSAPE